MSSSLSKMYFLYLSFLPLIVGILKLYTKLTLGTVKCSRHLVGKVVIVTGGNAGIGFETAKDMAERGAKVILACRSDVRGTAARDQIVAATGNQDVHFQKLDLASFASTRAFAAHILKTETRLDILINNAGIISKALEKTEDGLFVGIQSNHLGPFLLTNLLLPLLKSSAPSRIINVASLAYARGVIDFQNLNMEKETPDTYNGFQAYNNSKLCNVLMTVELARQLKGTGVTVNCLHPGVIRTDIMDGINSFWKKFGLAVLLSPIHKTLWEGAQTTIYLAVSPEVNDISGCYFSECKIKTTLKHARDLIVARKLWEVSAKLVNLN